MIIGIIGAILVLLLIMPYFLKKKSNSQWKHLIRRVHMPIGLIMIAVIVIHVMVTYSVWDTRHILTIISGIVMAIGIISMPLLWKVQKPALFLRTHRIIAAIVVIFLVIHIGVSLYDLGQYQKSVSQIEIVDIDAVGIADGTYQGRCDVGYINAEVSVQVIDEKIISVELVSHNHERGESAEQVVDQVVQKQSTDIDMITGATNSSKVIGKAIEQALKNAQTIE